MKNRTLSDGRPDIAQLKRGEAKKFREMNLQERLDYLMSAAHISRNSATKLASWHDDNAPIGENHITHAPMSVDILPGIMVNGKERTVPLITEEPSVVAAASHGAKMASAHGGFFVKVKGTTTPGQVQLVGIRADEIDNKISAINANIAMLIEKAQQKTPHLVAAGGGIVSITPRKLETTRGTQIIVNFEAECKDSMGANAVSKMAEGMASALEEITGGKVVGRILSNLTLGRLVEVEATFGKDALALRDKESGSLILSGDEIIERMLDLAAWANADQERATTHNKGIMNGITAVAMAMGQDTRAIESAAHSYAAYNDGKHVGQAVSSYKALSTFWKDANGDLVGKLVVPIPVGIIGGTIKSNPVITVCFEITQCNTPSELAAIIGAVGLAQNVSALRMLAGEGITKGHMPLHEKRVQENR